jgi:hypothetical protein
MSLTVDGYKIKGNHTADLLWSGANSADVDIIRNGVIIVTTSNDGFYTDNIGSKGGATYTFQVCEAGTTNCSAEVTIIF